MPSTRWKRRLFRRLPGVGDDISPTTNPLPRDEESCASRENAEGEAILRPSRRMDCFRIVSRERALQKACACFGAIFDPSRCRSLRRLTSGAIVRRRPPFALRGINSIVGGSAVRSLALL
jgi:hypothetical protein